MCTTSSFRSQEPLYIVILRDSHAESLLRTWLRNHNVTQASVTGNRLMIHHDHAWDKFRLTWQHDWRSITVWDAWNRRHLDL